jgi:4,5-DOPA dioxygenase extradiol
MARAALFVSHGAPDLAIAAHPAGRFLDTLGAAMPAPKAVLILSAHHVGAVPELVGRHAGRIVHDYRGFDPALRDLEHAAPDAPELVARVGDLLEGAGVPHRKRTERPLDHGAWVPLHRIDPEAKLPVVQLGISSGDARAHLELGRALTPLRDEDVLILASGSLTHALGEIPGWEETDAAAPPWVRSFADWIAERLEDGDEAALLDWTTRAPHALRNHPTPEHLVPLFVVLGAAGGAFRARRLHTSVSRTVLALDAWAFAPQGSSCSIGT